MALGPSTAHRSGAWRRRLAEGDDDVKRVGLRAYVAAVAGLGVAAVLWLPAFAGGPPRLTSPEFLLLAAYVVAGEVLPLRVMRGGREGVLTVSTTFAFAMLLWLGAAEAVVALAAASVCGDVVRRAPWVKVLFNAAQFAVSMLLAGAVLAALRPDGAAVGTVAITDTGLQATVAAAAVFFMANFALSGVAVALASGTPVWGLLRNDLPGQALWTGLLLSLSPIVVAAAETSSSQPTRSLAIAAAIVAFTAWLLPERKSFASCTSSA